MNENMGFGVVIGVFLVVLFLAVAALGASFKLGNIRSNIELCGADKIECYQKFLEMVPEK